MDALPVRGEAVRELDLPLPPGRMPLVRAGRPLKRWRYVGVFGPEVMLCTAEAWIGPLAQRFWGVAEPGGRLWTGRSLAGVGGVTVGPHAVRIDARDGGSGERVRVEATLERPAAGPEAVESVSASGRAGYVWTRKQAGVPASASVRVGERELPPAGARAVLDETAGYHARRTAWSWSAGVGRTRDGRSVAWNLVEGVNDDPEGSERTVWVEDAPSEAPPVRFDLYLTMVLGGDGAVLRFEPWATLAHRTRLVLVRSDYRQPFGTFSGRLPGGPELAAGYGVMERHDARW